LPGLDPRTWWRQFRALPDDSRTKTFVVAFLVAAVSALAVSVTAVSLKPKQEANAAKERLERMADLLFSLPGMADILSESGAEGLETRIVDLRIGRFASGIDAETFDADSAAEDPNLYTFIEEADDIAGIGRRPDLIPVHLLRRDGELVLLVVPAYGAGYQSTIRAYIALQGDLNTIGALSVYEQGETPGLGSRIAEPEWLARWEGRKVADETGAVRIEVVRGGTGEFEVDGISGATRSSSGVGNLVRFWLGENGFGPFLARLRQGEAE
jgi:Na+-transporting NADH:ubiquinone oxidoreductase subunit C